MCGLTTKLTSSVIHRSVTGQKFANLDKMANSGAELKLYFEVTHQIGSCKFISLNKLSWAVPHTLPVSEQSKLDVKTSSISDFRNEIISVSPDS